MSWNTTVDGSEIRRFDQLRLVVYPIIYDGFYASRWVVWDFFHQQYERWIIHSLKLTFSPLKGAYLLLVSAKVSQIKLGGIKIPWISGICLESCNHEPQFPMNMANWVSVKPMELWDHRFETYMPYQDKINASKQFQKMKHNSDTSRKLPKL